ncbi:hypothetical protein PC116_g29767 [Phytophthora cactorum]|nr:hypothetical protein PC116_g29767 [Phytophthora cactorum]
MHREHRAKKADPGGRAPDDEHGLELMGRNVADKRDIGVYLPGVLGTPDRQPSHE